MRLASPSSTCLSKCGRTAEFHCQFEYNTDLFERSTMQRMLGTFRKADEAALENPDLPLAQLPIMSEQEREQVLMEWNQTATDYSRDMPLHREFESQVNRSPDATAFLWAGKKWSYRQSMTKPTDLRIC